MIIEIPQSSLHINHQSCLTHQTIIDDYNEKIIESSFNNLELLLTARKPPLRITSDLKQVFLLKTFREKLSLIKTTEEAEILYFEVKFYLKQNKISELLKNEFNINLDDVLDDEKEIINKTPIFFANGKSLVLKVPLNVSAEKPNECRVCESLELDKISGDLHLVPVHSRIIKVQEDSKDKYSKYFTVWFLEMPKFSFALADYIISYNSGYVHMDVKLENIFVKSSCSDAQENGEWYLGDFGSAVYWKELLYLEKEEEIVSVEKVKNFISKIEDNDLKNILGTLIEFEGSELNL
ncbi:hypothetical protein HK099_008038 [Clydaea vesicula]|uniref:Protein kinase domain-containing protein n=1 Tax=Clydaea vesicula TaxID=447962 RepID=A0AAD5TWH4_9FUNG|nr:hypothetical protein HK099_008038 [Clydaea vesicula]